MPTPPLTLDKLRLLAEKASGLRHKRLGLRLDGNEYVLEEIDSGRTYILELDVTPQPRKDPFAVKVPGLDPTRFRTPPGDDDVTQLGDALFWSGAAIGKFVVPYYSSFRKLTELQRDIVAPFDSQSNVVAIMHLPDSEATLGSTTLTPAESLFRVTTRGTRNYGLDPIF